MKRIIILLLLLNSKEILASSKIIIKDAKTLKSVSYDVSDLTKTSSKVINLYPNVFCRAKIFLNPRRVNDSLVKTWVLMCDMDKLKIAPTFPCIKNKNGFIQPHLAETYVDNGTGGKRIKFECGQF
tara:strand:- start:1150 stop:1527 length:378 start_codon:yes stop_codon:yes gene_type:complete